MPVLDIYGITVAFPYSPYECQVAFMKNTIEAVQSAQNALLESPTGTGKTLCVLCSLLSWQQAAKAKVDKVVTSNKNRSNNDNGNDQVPIIYYASRTHAQLAQVVQELKKTVFTPKTVVLGSREQSCIHPKVSKISNNSAQAAICNRLCSQGKCEHKNKVPEAIFELSKLTLKDRIMDIEELGTFAKRKGACPFFTLRDGLESAELVLLPYNYLLDSQLGLSLNLQNSIVVIDEAHNIVFLCCCAALIPLCIGKLLYGRVFSGNLHRRVHVCSIRAGALEEKPGSCGRGRQCIARLHHSGNNFDQFNACIVYIHRF